MNLRSYYVHFFDRKQVYEVKDTISEAPKAMLFYA